MVGGYDGNYLSSVELFPPSDSCSIPDLPQTRRHHSLSLLSGGRLVVCGGWDGNYLDSCISWVAGNTSWTHFHTMRCLPIILHNHSSLKKHNHSVARSGHTAWTPPSLPDSIVLLGGLSSAARLTAETVPGIKSRNSIFESFSQAAPALHCATLERQHAGFRKQETPLS